MADPTITESNKKAIKRVLVVEDDASMRDILASRISEEGFQVLTAQDVKQGLQLALNESPDLILLDLLLPQKPGFTMLDDLRKDEKTKHIPVFILSNLGENNTIYKSVALKADAFFIKSDNSLEHISNEIKNKLYPVK